MSNEESNAAQEAENRRNAAVEANMKAAGVKTEERVQEDYFAFDLTFEYTMPDGISILHLKALTEGERKAYTKENNRDIRIKKTSGDAEMRMATGDEKYALLKRAIIGWNLVSGPDKRPVPFTPDNLTKFLDKANPVVIDGIHKEVTKRNPWLLQEMTSADIRKEIEALEEMYDLKLKEEEGKVAS